MFKFSLPPLLYEFYIKGIIQGGHEVTKSFPQADYAVTAEEGCVYLFNGIAEDVWLKVCCPEL